jgi:hypothetical protein
MSYSNTFKVFVDVFLFPYFLSINNFERGGVIIVIVNPNVDINNGHQWFANYVPTIPISLKKFNYGKMVFGSQVMAFHARRVILG